MPLTMRMCMSATDFHLFSLIHSLHSGLALQPDLNAVLACSSFTGMPAATASAMVLMKGSANAR